MATHFITSKEDLREKALIEEKFPYREPPYPADQDRLGPGVKIIGGVAVADSRPIVDRDYNHMRGPVYPTPHYPLTHNKATQNFLAAADNYFAALKKYGYEGTRPEVNRAAMILWNAANRCYFAAMHDLLPEREDEKVIPFPKDPKPKKTTSKPFSPKILPPRPAAQGTKLRHALRGRGTTAKSVSHIVVTADFYTKRLIRKAGDPLCKPLDKFPHGLTDIVPHNDAVCPKCAELAERYDLSLPDNVEVTIMPSSRKLGPDDPPVTYKLHSKWFNYNFGFPFAGYLRQWGWLRNHCVCKQCGAPVSTERGNEPVKGMELFDYYVCASGHPIRDERDLKRSDRQPKEAGSADEVIKGYPWLKAVVPDEIPF